MSSTDSSAEKRITGTSERREQIIQRLRAQGSVQVNDLSLLFGVSTVTIRNDLAFLEKQEFPGNVRELQNLVLRDVDCAK